MNKMQTYISCIELCSRHHWFNICTMQLRQQHHQDGKKQKRFLHLSIFIFVIVLEKLYTETENHAKTNNTFILIFNVIEVNLQFYGSWYAYFIFWKKITKYFT